MGAEPIRIVSPFRNWEIAFPIQYQTLIPANRAYAGYTTCIKDTRGPGVIDILPICSSTHQPG